MPRTPLAARRPLRVAAAGCFPLGLFCLLTLAAPPALSGTQISHDNGLALSPYSETGDRLQIRTVAVRADIRNGLSMTTLSTVFSNTIAAQCQASLDLTVPHDSVVTGYAYWFKGERIQAKLLDNDKAWEIYSTITSHHRDPAIMEQWYDTTYHLQIYPVEPGKDLRVEVSYLAPLESDERGLYYRLPLAAGPGARKLKRFSARVTLRGVETSRITDTEGSRPQVSGGTVGYSVTREDWKPEQDWLFRIRPRSPRFESAGEAAATSPHRGYFSVLFWTGRSLSRPRIRIDPRAARSIHLRGFQRRVPAGRRLIVEGKYLRPGRLKIAFRDARMAWTRADLTLPARVQAGPGQVPRSKKLWAASEIKRLSGALGHWERYRQLAAEQRAAVVRMSLAYGVMSPYTAWLAVPPSEFEYYKKVQQEARVQTNARSARGGDPLIRVAAAPDIVRVTALLPTGEPLPMVRLADGSWEGRFDLPAETAEGDYRVLLLLERADGRVKRLTLTYRIDRRAPTGQVRVQRSGDTARVTVTADSDTKLVYLLLPDGRRVFLAPDELSGRFTGECPVDALAGGSAELVLVDGAHNVTRVLLDPR